MKILFISESYLPQKNGMASVIRYLAEGLAEKGHSVAIATQRHNKKNAREEKIKNVDIYRFDIHRNVLKFPSGEVEEFKKFVLSFIADVYIFECIGSLSSDILFTSLNKIKGKKILHSHGNTFSTMKPFQLSDLKHTIGNTYNYIRLGIENWNFFPSGVGKFDACIYLSPIGSDKEIIRKNAKKKFELHNAADQMFFDYNPEKADNTFNLGIKNNKYLLSVANYGKVKNQLLLVRSYFEANITGYSLVLVGSKKNEYYYRVEKLVRELTKQKPGKEVVMLSGVERRLIPQIVDNATLYLTGSEHEEYSVSLVEAMSRGVPFVSTDVGNARLLPGGITVVKPEDMTKTIEIILSDENLYNVLSLKGKEFAYTNCREEIAVNQLLKIIDSI